LRKELGERGMRSTVKVLFVLLCLHSLSAVANQIYEMDRSYFASEEEYNYCKDIMKTSFEVKADDPGHLVIEILEDVTKKGIKIQLIQDEKRSGTGEDGTYQGDHIDRVYLVKYDGMDIYKYGLYSSIRILSFKNGIIVEKTPLNYFASEEMLNLASCQKIHYKKTKI
jgi:hypothetical protein